MDEISMFKDLRPAPPAVAGEISRAVRDRRAVGGRGAVRCGLGALRVLKVRR